MIIRLYYSVFISITYVIVRKYLYFLLYNCLNKKHLNTNNSNISNKILITIII